MIQEMINGDEEMKRLAIMSVLSDITERVVVEKFERTPGISFIHPCVYKFRKGTAIEFPTCIVFDKYESLKEYIEQLKFLHNPKIILL